jgi:hypothetical protein
VARSGADGTISPARFLLVVLVLSAVTAMVAALAWGWSNGTLHTTEQERFDPEFERIARPALTITVRCRCDIRRPPTSIVH